MASSNQDEISGSVERVTYYNSENGYTVLRLKPDERGGLPFKYPGPRHQLITVVGNLPEVNPGEWLKLTGDWVKHPKHGRQFQARKCEQSLPVTTEGVKRYLGSGLVRGIGPVMAERIVNEFGVHALDIIELEPGRLREVPGIGPRRIDSIIEAWEEQRAIKDVMLFLQSHGVSTNLAIKIYKQYGDNALLVVQNTPYKLVQDVHGIGFKTADRIAQALGLEHDSPDRIEAGIAYTLVRMADDGHVYMPQDELEPETEKILAVEAEKISTVMQSLEQSKLIRRETLQYEISSETEQAPQLKEEEAVYLTPLYYSEVGVAKRLLELIEHPTSRLTVLKLADNEQPPTSQPFSENVQPGVHLTEQQKMAVRTAVNSKVTVLTGGPGTGKTTTLRSLLDLLDQHRLKYALASPTGRAAKRLTEATGRPAKTIHRLLEFNPGEGFGRGEDNPLEADMIIIDEASMLDLALTHNLLKAISRDSHLLLVGDVDQLPSVGAGDVLRDLIKSGVTAVIRLKTIFRQASGSLIVHNAHRINKGLMPETPMEAKDFFLFIKEEAEEAADLLIDIVKNRLPARFGLDPFDDMQVLSPMYQGSTGVLNLNQKLQQALNPPGNKVERIFNNQTLRVGDKVMQTANNYDKNVYNGDIGRVTNIDPIKQILTVSIDGAPVVYDFIEADELMHAFAISVHKSQGSEYPCVVMPVMTQHYMLLQRNLLYTAVTRAKRMVVLVGTRKAIGIAINNNRVSERYTALDWRLQH